MTPFTLVMRYYINPGQLRAQAMVWTQLPKLIRDNLHVVIVDDGSPSGAAIDAMQFDALRVASFQLYRIGVDVPWNTDAARNIGMKYAPTEWRVMTDMDHIVPEKTWLKLMTMKLKTHRVYRFARVSAPDLSPYHRHPNSYAMSGEMFERIGGYDERFASLYGTDGPFSKDVQRTAEVVDLKEVLVRVPREVVPDASTTTLARKKPEDKINMLAIAAERAKEHNWRPLRYQFPYERLI